MALFMNSQEASVQQTFSHHTCVVGSWLFGGLWNEVSCYNRSSRKGNTVQWSCTYKVGLRPAVPSQDWANSYSIFPSHPSRKSSEMKSESLTDEWNFCSRGSLLASSARRRSSSRCKFASTKESRLRVFLIAVETFWTARWLVRIFPIQISVLLVGF